MQPHEKAISDLNDSGYYFDRHGKKHDIYFNAELGCMISLKRHDFDEDDLRYIRKEIKQNKERRG